MKSFQINGDDTKIELELFARSYNSSDYWDGNWVNSKVSIDIPGYNVSFNAYLRTDEIKDFWNELSLMNKLLKGKATLKNLDDYLHFECEMDRLGKINWSIETNYPPGDGAVLRFEFQSDQSHLPKLVHELNEILIEFPVVGKL